MRSIRELIASLAVRFGSKNGVNYPKCEFPLLEIHALQSFIDDRINSRRATSIIRLGDGEGLVLAKPKPEQLPSWDDVQLHFGPDIKPDDIVKLSQSLEDAVRRADAIGIRSDMVGISFPDRCFEAGEQEFLTAVRTHFPLRDAERHTLMYPGALRLALLHRFLKSARFSSSAVFFDAWVHYQLSSTGVLLAWLMKEERIGLISSKRELVSALRTGLPGLQVDFYSVPEMYTEADKKNWRPHLPDRFEDILENLHVAFPGQVFLVGAGICGKVYCDRIKALGGIAIDVGAVCDAWVNIPSRPRAFRSIDPSWKTGVPADLLLANQLAAMRGLS